MVWKCRKEEHDSLMIPFVVLYLIYTDKQYADRQTHTRSELCLMMAATITATADSVIVGCPMLYFIRVLNEAVATKPPSPSVTERKCHGTKLRENENNLIGFIIEGGGVFVLCHRRRWLTRSKSTICN